MNTRRRLALLAAIAGLFAAGCGTTTPQPADPLIYRPAQPIHYPIPR